MSMSAWSPFLYTFRESLYSLTKGEAASADVLDLNCLYEEKPSSTDSTVFN